MEILKSDIDNSVNFVTDKGLESRYVYRDGKYLSFYLSSQHGCKQKCRMCHLTATHQFDDKNANVLDYQNQVQVLVDNYKNLYPEGSILIDYIYYNFMARGEPLANTTFLNYNYNVFKLLKETADSVNLFSRFNISTIMPKSLLDLPCTLFEYFEQSFNYRYAPIFYYSIYSVNPAFRRKWLPHAMPVEQAIHQLKDWQDRTKMLVKLHWSFIEGENDKYSDVVNLCNLVKNYGLRADVNIVRYNSYSELHGKETSEDRIVEFTQTIKNIMNCNVDIITRVGNDVKASCGMFVNKGE